MRTRGCWSTPRLSTSPRTGDESAGILSAAHYDREGLPHYLVGRLERKLVSAALTVGILGMAFKGGSDDIRSSLSCTLKRILEFKADTVLCADPYVTADRNRLPPPEVLARSDVLIIAAPHPDYRDRVTGQPAAGAGNVLRAGVRA